MKILSWNSGAYLCITSLSLQLPVWRSAVDVYSSVVALHPARVTFSDVRLLVQNCDVISADTKSPRRWGEVSSAAHRRESNTCLVSERPADWQWCRMIGSLFCVLTTWTRVKIWADPPQSGQGFSFYSLSGHVFSGALCEVFLLIYFFMSSVFFLTRFGLLFYSWRDLLYVLVGFVPTHLLVKRTNGKWKEDCALCASTSTLQLNYFILKHNTPSLLLTSCIIIGGDSL